MLAISQLRMASDVRLCHFGFRMITTAKSALLLALMAALAAFPSAEQQVDPPDLTAVSLEDLMNIQVISISKKEQKLSKVGAAVFVITQEDIRRSGATNIPDLLRMVPGVQVSRIDAGAWAVGIRGFADRFGNKVLVLIDGRTVYSPDFSGVIWNSVDVPLEDIERIEVLCGPGGTVWGANAVNGVISITTLSAHATEGGLITTAAGSSEYAQGLAQYGGRLGSAGAYRIFGQYFNVGSDALPNAGDAGDAWHQSHFGFRSDWTLSSRDALTVEGDLLSTDGSETITTLLSNALESGERTLGTPLASANLNLLGRWTRTFSNGSDVAVQGYFNRDHTDMWGVNDHLDTFDLDLNRHFKAGARNDIIWGGGLRFTRDHTLPGYAISLLPLFPADYLANAFFQDEIALSPSLALTIGSKIERNTYTGFNYEPSAQLVWSASARKTVWLSAARAVRQPARLDSSVRIDFGLLPLPGGLSVLERILPGGAIKSEELQDVEAGYRAQFSGRLSVSAAAFLGFYSDLRTEQPGMPFVNPNPAAPFLVIPVETGNLGFGRNYGGEMFANWKISNHWNISPGYSLLYSFASPGSTVPNTQLYLPATGPRNQFFFRSLANLSRRVEWDTSLAYTGSAPDSRDGVAPAYTRLDTRLGWHFGEAAEISLVGQNLLTPRHLEIHPEYPTTPA